MADPIPHDGWSSRKVIMSSILTLLLLGLSAAAVAVGKATFAEASSFVNWAIGTIWLPLVVGMSMDKLAEVKREIGSPP